MNRREFLIKSGLTAAGCAAAGLLPRTLAAGAGPNSVSLICDPADPVASSGPVRWALGELEATLAAAGIAVRRCARLGEAPARDRCVVAVGPGAAILGDASVPAPSGPEALALVPASLGGREVLIAAGGGVRGLVYAVLELNDAAADGAEAALAPAGPVAEKPVNPVRSVMRSFTSEVEDKGWYHDRDFWRRYLTMLTTHRFNRFNLAFGLGYDAPSNLRDTYLYFAYPFLLPVPGYDVRASGLPDAERDRNLETLRFVSDEAARRGLDFQLGLWTHAYAWSHSPNANYTIIGLTPATQAAYSRDALALLLRECPSISGVTFRIHGESGVPEGSYDLWRTIFSACANAGRTVRIDMHAKGMTDQMIDVAVGTGQPFAISPKFWAEHLGLPYHQADIRPNEIPKRARGAGAFAESNGARSFLRYGYGDLLRRGRRYDILFRIWPGTQRLLLSGDAAFGAGYGRAMGFGGAQGCEIFEPLSFKGREGSGLPYGRSGYADRSLVPAGGDHEKFLVTYRYWGRLLYHPETSPEGWRRQFRRDYGPAAGAAEVLLRHASRILPLITTAHLPSASNNSFWPEMYVNMEIASPAPPRPYNDSPEPRRFGTVSPLDPQLFSRIEDHADDLLAGRADGRYSPVEVAQFLEDLSHSTYVHLEETTRAAGNSSGPALRRLAIDTRVQAGIGRFFGEKLRAGVLFALYQRSGDPRAKAAAARRYRAALEAWRDVVRTTQDVYLPDVSFGDDFYKRGHWADRLPAIEADLAAVEAAQAEPAGTAPDPVRLEAAIRWAESAPERPSGKASGELPQSFRRGEAVPIVFSCAPRPTSVRLHYRRVNQGERWSHAVMEADGAAWRSEIPASYTDSPFDLQFYFEPTDASGQAWLHPGLGAALAHQPYFVAHQTQSVLG